jgi:hypothetical protein
MNTTLMLGPREARFLPADRVAPVGPQLLQEQVLRHVPPTALEAELAIEVIEEAVMPLHREVGGGGGTLRVEGGAEVQALAALAGALLDAQAVEDLFSRAAAIAQGRPAASDPVLAQPAVFATLLILREVLHHLAFARLALISR